MTAKKPEEGKQKQDYTPEPQKLGFFVDRPGRLFVMPQSPSFINNNIAGPNKSK